MLLKRSVYGLVRTYSSLPQHIVDIPVMSKFQHTLTRIAKGVVDNEVVSFADVCLTYLISEVGVCDTLYILDLRYGDMFVTSVILLLTSS